MIQPQCERLNTKSDHAALKRPGDFHTAVTALYCAAHTGPLAPPLRKMVSSMDYLRIEAGQVTRLGWDETIKGLK